MASSLKETVERTKRSRNPLSLEMKIAVLDCLRRGLSNAAVGRLFGVNESSIRSIYKREDSIRANVASGRSLNAKDNYVPRSTNMVQMEKALNVWIADHRQKHLPLTPRLVRAQGKKIYTHLFKESSFKASKRWFINFKKRYNHNDLTLIGVSSSSKLQDLIKEKGYLPEQVLITDEKDVFWENMSKETSFSKEDNSANRFHKLLQSHSDVPLREDLFVDPQKIREIMNMASQLSDKVQELDPLMERSLKFRRGLNELCVPYKEMEKIISKKQKQALTQNSFKSFSMKNKDEDNWLSPETSPHSNDITIIRPISPSVLSVEIDYP